MDKILRGVMKYRVLHRTEMVEQFRKVRDNPVVRNVINILTMQVW